MKSGILITLFFISILFQGCSEDEPTKIIEPVRSIEITNPEMNSNVPDSTTVEISTNINDLVRVELYIDQSIPSQEAIFKGPPYKFLWNTRIYEDGSQHILQAKGYDRSGDLTASKYVIVNVYRFMPSNLMAFIKSASFIELDWIDNCSFETGFEVEEAINDSDFVKIADVDSNITTYNLIDTVKLNNTYLFRVRAKAGNSFSGYSNIASAMVLLNIPTGLDISFIADTAATLRWVDNNDFETGYLIQRRSPQGGYIFVKEVPANTTQTIVQDSFIVGKSYDYILYAKMGNFLSGPAHFPYKILQFLPPYNLTVEGNDVTSLTLKWKDSNSFGLGFIIERTEDGINYSEIGRTGGLAFTDNNIDTVYDYGYRIAAYSRYNKSDYSDNIIALFADQLKQVQKFLIPYVISEAALSYDASVIAFSSNIANEPAIPIYDTFTGQHKLTLSRPDSLTRVLSQLTICSDNRLLAAAGDNHYVTIWDINSGTVVHRINNTQSPRVMQFSPDGQYLIIEKLGTLVFYDVQSWQHETRITTSYFITYMDINRDETIIATADGQTNVKLWDYNSGILLREIPQTINAYPLEFNRAGTKLYSVVNTELLAWDVNSASIVLDIVNFRRINTLAINEEKNIAVSPYTYPGMGVWDLVSGDCIQVLPLDIDEVFFSPDNYLIGRRGSPSYYIWELTKKWVSPFQ